MRKLMVEFLRKFENRGIKIARVNSIRIANWINTLKFCTMLWFRCDFEIFKQTSRS